MEVYNCLTKLCLITALKVSVEDDNCECDENVLIKLANSFLKTNYKTFELSKIDINEFDNFLNKFLTYEKSESAFSDNTLYVPNLNTISTIADRISIECVKLSHAMCKLSIQEINSEEYNRVLITQKAILEVLSTEFAEIIKNIICSKKYEFITEYRTFK